MLDILVRASIGGGLTVIVLWLLCRALPRLSPATRTTMWWCASAKFLIALAWVVPLELPADSAPVLLVTSAENRTLPGMIERTGVTGPTSSTNSASPTNESGHFSSASARALVLQGWLGGVLVAFSIAGGRWWRLRRLMADADAAPIALRHVADELAYRLGLSHAPEVKTSDRVDTPLVTGLFRPVIVLPRARFGALDRDSQRMALCHELAHVRRADLVLGVIPALAERLFFFHPLAVYAAREYAISREAACDQLVIEALDAAPHDYAQLLLDLGVSPVRTRLAAAGAPYSFSNLKRRLVMLRIPSVPSPYARLTAAAAVCASIAMLVPLHLVAGVQPEAPSAARGDQYLEPEVTEAESELKRERDSAPAEADDPAKRPARQEKQSYGDGNRFIMLRGGSDDAIWHGSSSDHARAKRHQRGDEPLLWFMRAGEEYVVRNPTVVAEAEAIWEPVGQLGGEMGALGGKLGALGGRQGEFGAKQGALGGEQGRLGVRQAELALKQASLGLKHHQELTEEERAAIESEQRELEVQMRELSREMEKLAAEMREFEVPMRDLEREMQPISKELEKLGKQMEERSHRAEAEMEALIERTLKDGTAEKVR